MNKPLAAAAVAASVAVGGLAGAALGGPVLAGAADTATGAVDWVRDALGGLVDDGTLTQQQADAVEAALEEARPEHPFGHHVFGIHADLGVVADAIGIDVDDLRAALEDGRTVAEVAEGEGVEVQAVVDAIVDAQREDLAGAVDDGALTQEQADEILARAEEAATAFVRGEAPPFGMGPGPLHHGFPGPGFAGHDEMHAGPSSETS